MAQPLPARDPYEPYVLGTPSPAPAPRPLPGVTPAKAGDLRDRVSQLFLSKGLLLLPARGHGGRILTASFDLVDEGLVASFTAAPSFDERDNTVLFTLTRPDLKESIFLQRLGYDGDPHAGWSCDVLRDRRYAGPLPAVPLGTQALGALSRGERVFLDDESAFQTMASPVRFVTSRHTIPRL